MTNKLLLIGIVLFTLPRVGSADTFAVDPARSVFAVLTQKGGIAASRAHDHLIMASEYTTDINVANGAVTAFSLQCKTKNLAVDDPQLKSRWEEIVTDAGLLRSPFADISAADRDTVRQHMLDTDQLDAVNFPDIKANVTAVTAKSNRFQGQTYTHTATLAFTVHGVTITRDIAANIKLDGDKLTIEAAGSFTFSEFGIRAYSAFFGAVKNLDEFFIYCALEATRQPTTP